MCNEYVLECLVDIQRDVKLAVARPGRVGMFCEITSVV